MRMFEIMLQNDFVLVYTASNCFIQHFLFSVDQSGKVTVTHEVVHSLFEYKFIWSLVGITNLHGPNIYTTVSCCTAIK
jgi:hypothetical protein